MSTNQRGTFSLFQFKGIHVSIHWSWFMVAMFEIQNRNGEYSSIAWNVAEYLSVFTFVLCHEFGHAFACRQVGGQSEDIVLWPLGGIAYVRAPQRPGAQLWSIVAGPLVNVIFVLLFFGLRWGLKTFLEDPSPDFMGFLKSLLLINMGLLIFNLLPIYPLDGGQILRSLLWYPLGPILSLFIASAIGILGSVALIGLAIYLQSLWTGIMALFLARQAFTGFQTARRLSAMEKILHG